MPNMLLVICVPPEQPLPVKSWTLQDLWRCPVVSGMKTLAADHSSPVNCEVEPPWIGLVVPTHPTVTRSDWDLGSLEARTAPLTLLCVPQTIPEQFVQCGRVHYPEERGHCHHGRPLPWRGVPGSQQCLGRRHTSNWRPHERHPGYPSRTLPGASHSLHRLVFFPQCILVPSLLQVNGEHVPGHPHDVKENGTHRTRQPSSIAPRFSSDTHMPIVGTFWRWTGVSMGTLTCLWLRCTKHWVTHSSRNHH